MINIGLAYLEQYLERYHNYIRDNIFKSIEFFNKALRSPKGNRISADIMNNLGVSYYELGDYDQALEFFEKALEYSSDLASYNKNITLEKKGCKRKIYTADGKWVYK